MALTRCPECRKKISESAQFCPNCGFSFKCGQKTMRILTALKLEPYPPCRCRKRWFHFTFTL